MTRVIVAMFILIFGFFAPASANPAYTKNVAIVIYDGVEVLDFAGPAEVFAAAGSQGQYDSQKAFNVYTVSRTRKPIVSQGFIDVTPDYGIEDSPRADIIVFPGGGSDNVTKDPVWMEWVKKSTATAQHVLTVCTGAFIAGKAGLLDGGEATTYYRAVPSLAAQYPNVRVHPGRRFVDNGKVITTAGVSAGIDGSLHLVARLLGRYVADRTAQYMEYKWSPESRDGAAYTLLNPQLDERGRALQRASILMNEGNGDAALTVLRELVAANPADAEAWLNIGRIHHTASRYGEAIEAHEKAARGVSQRPAALFNLTCAYALSGQRDKAIETAAKAIDAGYRVKWSWEEDDDLDSVRDDPRYKALVAKL